MKTSEVLNKAADLIEERGWTSGSGWGGEGVPLCLEGGLIAAMGLPCTADGPIEVQAFESCPAYTAVRSYLQTAAPLWAWNDAQTSRAYRYGMTWDEAREVAAPGVIEVLRAAAVIEAAREEQPAEVSA